MLTVSPAAAFASLPLKIKELEGHQRQVGPDVLEQIAVQFQQQRKFNCRLSISASKRYTTRTALP